MKRKSRSSKRTARTLRRKDARYKYTRQSTPRQVSNDTGSLASQRNQAEYARLWGWPESSITIIPEKAGGDG